MAAPAKDVPLPSLDFDGVCEYLSSGNARRIMVMLGAGISVAAGIPDFRTPGTGLYSQVRKYQLPTPESLFSIDYLKEKPEAFFQISKEMRLWPGTFAPTYVHHFVALLRDRGLLFKCCTQNVDGLERSAGLRDEDLVEAHGTFASASCIGCHASVAIEVVRAAADEGEVPLCAGCGGIVKPDVVFFGEALPEKFYDFYQDLCRNGGVDLLLVIGTSLKVYPFAGLVEAVPPHTPRVVVNNTRVGSSMFFPCDEGKSLDDKVETSDTDDESDQNHIIREAMCGRKATRDVLIQDDCQVVVQRFAAALGFEEELLQRYQSGLDAVKQRDEI